MLATKAYQVEHGWVRTSLGYSSPRGINSDYYINSQYKTHRRKSGPVWGGNTFFFWGGGRGGGGGKERVEGVLLHIGLVRYMYVLL